MSKRINEIKGEARMLGRVVWRTFQEQWEVSRPLLIINIAFMPVTALLPLLTAFLTGNAINKLVSALSGGVPSGDVYIAFGLAAIAGLSGGLINPFQRYIRDNSEVGLELYLRRKLNEHMITADLPTLESPKFVELFNKSAYRHIWAHRRVTDQVFQLGSSFIQLFAAAAILIHFSIWLLPVLLLAIVPSA